jgi:hypothetical protein
MDYWINGLMDGPLRSAAQLSSNPTIHSSILSGLCSFVVKSKNPTAGWQWGSINLVNKSEPDRRATQQQRIQQQIQIQIAVHAIILRAFDLSVKFFLSADKCCMDGFHRLLTLCEVYDN